ncbi:hypothetical protein EDD16DRAFT_1519894 [Pisolithus croceorrhizus]|nr:hypothetical protein EDD16DRAFT_1519894 [Pisolithus croceorrhizus]KAI6160126.1 hypothetical protein EDD17DRAFT_1510836 [Pisolithus thermaeus]
MSPRASEKKKHAWAKSLEVEVLQQMVKTLGSSHSHMIESMAELLQEMTYPELELPAESGMSENGLSRSPEVPVRVSKVRNEGQEQPEDESWKRLEVKFRLVVLAAPSTARVMKRTWTVGSGASLKALESTWRGVGSGSAQGRGDLGGNEDDGGDTLVFNLPKKGNAPKQALVINTSSAGRAGGVPEARETEVVEKKVKNEWECHVARECKGLELSTGEVWLDPTKAGRWEMEELVVIQVHAVLGNPNKGAINIAGVMLPGGVPKEAWSWWQHLKNCLGSLSKIPGKIQGIGQVELGFVVPACLELGYCARARKSQGWVARGLWGSKPRPAW